MKRYVSKKQEGSPDNDYLVHVLAHKSLVTKYMATMIEELALRSSTHDDSKLHGMEKDMFVNIGVVDGDVEYQSDEYIENISKENTALAVAKHYENNDHHPEHHREGIEDMDLIQIIEMLVDWKVGGLAYEDGSIMKSIEKNKERFGLDDQVTKILENTARRYLREDYNNANE